MSHLPSSHYFASHRVAPLGVRSLFSSISTARIVAVATFPTVAPRTASTIRRPARRRPSSPVPVPFQGLFQFHSEHLFWSSSVAICRAIAGRCATTCGIARTTATKVLVLVRFPTPVSISSKCLCQFAHFRPSIKEKCDQIRLLVTPASDSPHRPNFSALLAPFGCSARHGVGRTEG